MISPALLQEASPPAGEGNMALVGYALVAVGALDVLLALLFLLTEKPADRRTRLVFVGALGAGGAAMIGVGILFWMGILGKG